MTDPAEISAIIEQYERHGWRLRRVLLTRELADALGDTAGLFPGADVRIARGSALWFSRRSHADREAWELRRVSSSPFAVVEVFPDGITDQERDRSLEDAESRLFDPDRPKETSH